MKIYEILTKKKHGEILSPEEIDFVVRGFLSGTIKDYQMSALLMSICIKGMTFDETVNLTRSMINSGETIDLSNIKGIKADKHSTGGVGDKTSLIVLPLMASFGLKISKMSGRGLGHTGGTLDKLESIPGFRTDLSSQEMTEIVNSTGFVIAGQTKNLVPADKKIYALRDVTATIDNISLISSSIMSKKIASGADNIILDVKVGSGAFLKTLDEAAELSEYMVKIGEIFGRNVIAVLSNMSQPLGNAVGNSLEVVESIRTLENRGPEDLKNLCVVLNSFMLYITGICSSVEKGISETVKMLATDKPLKIFREFIAAQHGDVSYIDDTQKFPEASKIIYLKSPQSGYIKNINAEKVGFCSLWAGAGRETKESAVDFSAGVKVKRKAGEYINKGEILGEIHTNRDVSSGELRKQFLDAYEFSDSRIEPEKIVLGYVDKDGFKEIIIPEM